MLGSALVARGHNVILISAFPASDSPPQQSVGGFVEEIAPPILVSHVQNFTDRDLMGRRMAGEESVSIDNALYRLQVI